MFYMEKLIYIENVFICSFCMVVMAIENLELFVINTLKLLENNEYKNAARTRNSCITARATSLIEKDYKSNNVTYIYKMQCK